MVVNEDAENSGISCMPRRRCPLVPASLLQRMTCAGLWTLTPSMTLLDWWTWKEDLALLFVAANR